MSIDHAFISHFSPYQKKLNQGKQTKEGPLTKNSPIDFAQSWAIYMKNPSRFMVKRKRG
jgi:hypothetical protein